MHIGTARTALFNWLYARHTGGKYLLRVEDTDRERSTEAAVQVIFDGLAWLGLEADETPVFQAARADRHVKAVDVMLARGSAYKDFMTPDELEAERTNARAEGRVVRSPWRDLSPNDAPDRPFVVRLKAPLEGETVIDDQVKGRVVFQNKDLDDLILLRTDGTPTYNLPLIHGPDGTKLSKRHGAQAVSEFADMGYLPEAMRNYLAKLGWGHGDDEIFSDDQAISWFDIKDVVGAPARLDWAKLNHLNNHYIRQAEPRRLADLVAAVHHSRDFPLHDDHLAVLTHVIPFVRDGAKTTLELADATVFALSRRPLVFTEKARDLVTHEETRARLGRLRLALDAAPSWDVATLEGVNRGFAESEGVGMGKFGPALRAALSGGAPAPDLAGALVALGKVESLARLDDALSLGR